MPTATPQATVQQVVMRPPPTRGLNTVDPIAAMPPTDAVEMDNFISADSGLSLRGGWYEYATQVGGASPAQTVRTIMSFDDALPSSLASPLSQSELFAATDTGIYLIEGGGALGSVAADLALSGAQFAGVLSVSQFAAAGANYLVACSETDGALIYDGVSWLKIPASGTGAITGVDPAILVQVVAFKKRLGFVERNSGRSWWLPVGNKAGAASVFDFGPLFSHGGGLLAMASWTQDGGEGVDDYLIALSSSGDVAIFKGNDPTSATDWSCAGIWYIGTPPVGRRCFTTAGGNVYIVTEFGIIPIAQVVSGGLDNVLMAGTDETKQLRKLQELFKRDFAVSRDSPGWELIRIPNLALMHLARPSVSVSENIQYVFHLHTLAWSRMLDVPGTTFYYRLGETYAGTIDGRVLRVFDGTTDRMKVDGSGGQEVRARVTPAFDYFDTPASTKRALMVRANFQASQRPAYAVAMNADLFLSALSLYPTSQTTGGSLWDQSFWDTAHWGGGVGSFSEWRTVRALGKSFAPTILLSSTQAVVMASLSYMIQPGGPL